MSLQNASTDVSECGILSFSSSEHAVMVYDTYHAVVSREHFRGL